MKRNTLWAVGTVFGLILALTSLPGCAMFRSNGGGKVALTASRSAPAAQGEIATKTTNDQNTQVKIKVKHLAPPESIAQGATTYVVWVRPLGMPVAQGERTGDYPERQESQSGNEVGVYNLGGMKISKDLDGELNTTTPFRAFELFITAESSSAVTAPNGERVLWATITK